MGNPFEKPQADQGTPAETAGAEREALTFERAAEELMAEAERQMNERSARERRVYHTIEHPNTLKERAEKVAGVFGVSEEQRALIGIEIGWHDVVIDVDPADPENIIATIKRHRGARESDQPSGAQGNEAESARMMERAMRGMNERAGRPVFSEEQVKTAVFAVEATYPGVALGADFKGARFKDYPFYAKIVERNPGIGAVIDELEREGIEKGALFYQPHLEKPLENGGTVPPEALVMVLDDLGGAGMASREEFALEGDKEFLELHTNITNPDNVRRFLEGDGERDEEDRGKAAAEMLGWLKSQTSFVAWQMLRIEKIILLLRENGQIEDTKAEQLHSLFNRFEDNIKATLERARSAEREYRDAKEREGSKAAFGRLARSMHLVADKDRASV